jgi:hypothetical protein
MRRSQLQGHDDGGLGDEPQRCQVLPLEVERDGVPQVSGDLVEGLALGHHGDLVTVDHKHAAVFGEHGVYRVSL